MRILVVWLEIGKVEALLPLDLLGLGPFRIGKKWTLSTKIQDRVDVSAPKLSTIKYLECENHVSEELFVVSTVSISSSLPY